MMLVQKIIYCLSRLLKDVNCDLCTLMINLKLKNEEGEGLVIIYSLVDRILEDQKVSQRGREGNQSSPTEHDSRRL